MLRKLDFRYKRWKINWYTSSILLNISMYIENIYKYYLRAMRLISFLCYMHVSVGNLILVECLIVKNIYNIAYILHIYTNIIVVRAPFCEKCISTPRYNKRRFNLLGACVSAVICHRARAHEYRRTRTILTLNKASVVYTTYMHNTQ